MTKPPLLFIELQNTEGRLALFDPIFRLRFDVVQQAGKRVVGGSACFV